MLSIQISKFLDFHTIFEEKTKILFSFQHENVRKSGVHTRRMWTFKYFY